MTTQFVLTLMRVLLPVSIGYGLARWLGFDASPLRALLRWSLLPAVLFTALLGSLSQRSFVVVAGAGVVTVLLGFALLRYALQRAVPDISLSAASPALAAFAFPWMTLDMGARGASLVVIGVLFVAVALTLSFAELGERGFGAVIREPWLYAAAAALVFRLGSVPTAAVVRIVDPLTQAGWVLLLVFLGTKLHPFTGFTTVAAWAGALVRIIVGVGVALLVSHTFELASSVDQSLLLAGLAPAAPTSLGLVRTAAEREDGHATVVVGAVLTFVAFVVWRVFFS
jgi:hypothetical protein